MSLQQNEESFFMEEPAAGGPIISNGNIQVDTFPNLVGWTLFENGNSTIISEIFGGDTVAKQDGGAYAVDNRTILTKGMAAPTGSFVVITEIVNLNATGSASSGLERYDIKYSFANGRRAAVLVYPTMIEVINSAAGVTTIPHVTPAGKDFNLTMGIHIHATPSLSTLDLAVDDEAIAAGVNCGWSNSGNAGNMRLDLYSRGVLPYTRLIRRTKELLIGDDYA